MSTTAAVILRFYKGAITHKEIFSFTLEHIFNLVNELNKIIDLETKEPEKPKLGAVQLASLLKKQKEKNNA